MFIDNVENKSYTVFEQKRNNLYWDTGYSHPFIKKVYESLENEEVNILFRTDTKKLLLNGLYYFEKNSKTAVEDFVKTTISINNSSQNINHIYNYYVLPKIMGKKILVDHSVKNILSNIHEILPKSAEWFDEEKFNSIFNVNVDYSDKIFQRLIALNEFLNDNYIDDKTTFGSYMNDYIKNINNLTSILQLNKYTLTKKITESYFKTPLMYLPISEKINNEKFSALTKKDLKNIVEYNSVDPDNNLFNVVDKKNYTQQVDDMIENIKNLSKPKKNTLKNEYNFTDKSISNDLMKIASKIMIKTDDDAKNYADLFKNVLYLIKRITSNREYSDFVSLRRSITNSLIRIEKENNDFKLIHLNCILYAMENDHMFRSADTKKATYIVEKCLKEENGFEFIKFITEVFFEYNGPLASYSEWKRIIELNSKENTFLEYDFGPEILFNLMGISDKAKTKENTFREQQKRLFKIFYKDTL